ncbi:uncharacterized protein PV06_09479 [Exophiala oligosperma]|uniref:FAD/NAD(P)-binding domain-containing protein n=1 Tax=Exophiala oligosperma TaxID=215243 RepID=A0A0D2D5U7_9EURO|nr:uncharacterized protein PV06_09479 [Exophiala oligosperma]KIW38523.1 hypothetical protein PV06_09479 [Exophiala oligosperma]
MESCSNMDVGGHRKTAALYPEPAYTPRGKIRIATVGAGFSGLIFAYKLQHEQPEFQDLVDHTILEARADLGGTWLVNRYPGVQCDVPAHIYAFPFDPKTDWSHFYATGPQIHEYMKDTVQKWNLDRDVRLSHKVTQTLWLEERSEWEIKVETPDGEKTLYADILVSGQGVLNSWRWPNIPGFEKFKGHKCHSADWHQGYDYSNKTIGVIGNGSSGVQIIPQLADLPGTKVICFQKSSNYVYTPFAPATLLGRDDQSGNPAYTEEDKRKFREDPEFHRDYRQKITHTINAGFKRFIKGSPENKQITEDAREQMRQKLHNDPFLCEKLIPEWGLACRRITPAEGYLEALQKPNVELVVQGVVSADEDSITSADGRTFKVDVIACATGFDVSWKPSWHMIGRNGVDLRQEWDADPRAYLSIAAADMPNYFMFLGPNAVVTHGSLIESINWSANYFLKWIRKMAEEDIETIVPRRDVVDELIEYEDAVHQTFVWADNCRSWFKRNTIHGRNVAGFGGSALLFRQVLEDLRPEDFEIKYRSKNRWSFLGNGFTRFELDTRNNLAWYIEK